MKMHKCLFFIFLSVLTVFGENPYNGIVERNGFELTADKPTQILPPIATLPVADVYLTGIDRKDKIYTAYMVVKDKTQNKFLGLRVGGEKDGVEVMKITKDTVFISHNGILQELTFKQNSLPSIVTKVATKPSTRDKREERGDRGGDTNERRRQYDEWRKSRERGK